MLSDESTLHYIWKYKLFQYKNLLSATGDKVEIIHTGIHNQDAGPDFQNSKIRINDTLWAGTVEIHIRSSDWIKHNHQKDKSYDNVILHVVWHHDKQIFRTDGSTIHVLELKNLVDEKLLSKIQALKESESWIPCENYITEVDSFTVSQCLDRLLIERLEYKSAYIQEVYQETKGSWEDTFYITLARNFGFKVNTAPFEILAKNLPQHILAKHKNSTMQTECLIFGAAGFLETAFLDDYPNRLKTEYNFLRNKYGLKSLEKHWWKFTKVRPDNFPTIRLAQFAALVNQSSHLFSKLLEIEEVIDYKKLFKDLYVHHYWTDNYDFDKKRKNSSENKLGNDSIDVLLINSIAPILFYYGKLLGIAHYQDKAVNLLQVLKPENNSVIKKFKDYGFKIESTFDSQAVIQMKNFYCDQKKCLNCGIGIKILKG